MPYTKRKTPPPPPPLVPASTYVLLLFNVAESAPTAVFGPYPSRADADSAKEKLEALCGKLVPFWDDDNQIEALPLHTTAFPSV